MRWLDTRWDLRSLALACLCAWPALAEKPAYEPVELFQARTNGEIEIQLIPKDATRATIIVRNKTTRPLQIQLPAAFAGVPVLAQFGGQQGGFGGAQGGGLGGGGLNVGGQGIGGGFGGGGLGGGGLGGGGLGGGGLGGGGGGFFNLPPEAVKKAKLATVCLEHGKKDPNPRIPYALIPIQQFTENQQVIELCGMLGRNEIDQVSAQAAAWHLASGLSWNELAQKVRARHLNGSVDLYFTPEHIQRAFLGVNQAIQRAAVPVKSPPVSPGEYTYGAAN